MGVSGNLWIVVKDIKTLVVYDVECKRVPEDYGWKFMTLFRRQRSRPSERTKKCKKAKCPTIAMRRREVRGKGEKERYTHLK